MRESRTYGIGGGRAMKRTSLPLLKRREFITLFGGAAAAWPVAARGQQSERMRRIGVLLSLSDSDPEGRLRVEAFRAGPGTPRLD